MVRKPFNSIHIRSTHTILSKHYTVGMYMFMKSNEKHWIQQLEYSCAYKQLYLSWHRRVGYKFLFANILFLNVF